MYPKARILVREIRVHLREDKRENSALSRVLAIVAAVHEHILLARVTVQIAEHDEAALLMYLLHETLTVEYCRVQCLVWHLPSTIQVTACKTTAIVTVNYTVRIQHRNHFKHEVLSEHLRFNIVWVS